MSTQKYITSSCIISNNTVYKNGEPVFVNTNTGITHFLHSVYKHFEIAYARFNKMDNLTKLGWMVAEILLKDSFEKDNYKPEDVGLVLSNANSSLDTDRKYMASVADIPSPSLFVYTLPNIVTGEICIRNNFKGEGAFFISENFDAGFIESYVNNLLDNGILQTCICGWVELLGDEYKVALFLVEKEKKGIAFTKENMVELFDIDKIAAPQAYIAGVGVISAIGNNVQECLNSFKNEQVGMGAITNIDTIHRDKLPVAEVKLSNDELAMLTGMAPGTSRTTLLSLMAAKEALDDAAIPGIANLRVGFVSGNTVGGMDKSEDFYVPFNADHTKGKLKDVFDHECGCVTEAVAGQIGATDFITTISTACSSSANAIFYGDRLIKSDMLDVVVCGGAESLTKFTLNGFNTLMILDNQFCQPFDENRRGLNLGEGAGYLVLVSEKVAKTLSGPLYGKLSGYNNSNDAYHQTASSPEGEGSYLAMQKALKKGRLQPSDIDYINLHGTGTPNNDSSEGTAVKRLFAPYYPPMSSTKSFTGHTLGASGGIEAVFSVLAIRHGIIYPNLRFETQMAELPFAPETQYLSGQKINHVMSNSFGFGGNCTSLIFSAV